MTPAATRIIPLLIFVPVIVWRMHGRIRRSIGRQHLTRQRPWFTVTLFPILVLLLGFGALRYPTSLAALAGGVAAGALLGAFGLTKTKFENTPEGVFYTPNAHLGIAVSVLFVGRVLYRYWQIYSADPSAQPAPGDFVQSPATLAIFGLLAGYYVSYAVGLIRHWKSVETAPPPAS